MSIIESAIFQEICTEEPENKPPRIMLRHSRTNKVIETVGAVLEAQFMDGDNHLLFISEGIPYEESLHILLISSDLIIKDFIELSAAYTPGMLRNIRIVQPNKIQFSFFNPEETWVLECELRAGS